ncbi:UDP-N-acetylglucosamine 1-carboxyvinyltransferase [Candidatus Peregrinibacteria bacterium]|nr:UDP-N-acetylglucosamine 1-carboxyvinyltransferase [Candidatus Peregrinibacteria bacterium]
MLKYLIKGGIPLKGEVRVSGSKNATLPIMCATLLTKEKCVIKNVPAIDDVYSMIEILRGLGSIVKFEKNILEIETPNIKTATPAEDAVCHMRASILIAGPMLARKGKVDMGFPGGCILGKRPLATHTHVFEKLGAKIKNQTTRLEISAAKLRGARIVLPEMSVTGTENAVMAGVLAEGKTEIRLAATEPHVQDLCKFLKKMGAKISGIGTNILVIDGVKSLHGAEYSVCGDYLEAGTLALAGIITHGNIKVADIDTSFLDILWQKLADVGAKFKVSANEFEIFPHDKKLRPTVIRTAVYPSFPTDLQAPMGVLLTQANGVSKVFETLFEGRLGYLFELEKMGAKVEFMNAHQALIIGPTHLRGCPIASMDIRAGAAMVLAGLAAEGQTEVSNINYLHRGYENLDEKLRNLGADIQKIAPGSFDFLQGSSH